MPTPPPSSSDDPSTAAGEAASMPRARVGAWLVGARGSVATTATLGLHALAAGLTEPVGLTTVGPAFDGVDLVGLDGIVVGGHDVATTPLVKRAEELAAGGLLPGRLIHALADRLELTEADLRAVPEAARTQQEAIDARARDIEEFRRRHDLDHVVVVDVSSTEPLPPASAVLEDGDAFDEAVRSQRHAVPASTEAAAAAIAAGAGYACFTPSLGLGAPVLRRRADAAGLPYAGQDGKTGETLLRTVLAPMFTARAFSVHSWAGTNLLGGGDGATLADPEAVDSKLKSKTRGLHDLLGEQVVAPLHIDNVPDMGDVKTSWDHVSATAFLGSRVTLQTTWSAYDSALAAPLVIDLVRLVALAMARGESGALAALGAYFKDPWGSDVHAFAEQQRALVTWAHGTPAR